MIDATVVARQDELSQDEKAYAGLAHALMTCTWWIGPLVIYLTKRESRFVAFHALQALFWQILFTVLYICGMAAFMVVTLSTVALQQQKLPANQSFPVALFVMLPFFWLFILGAFAATLTLAIVYCLRAMRGEWSGYPIIGNWARKIVCG